MSYNDVKGMVDLKIRVRVSVIFSVQGESPLLARSFSARFSREQYDWSFSPSPFLRVSRRLSVSPFLKRREASLSAGRYFCLHVYSKFLLVGAR